MSGLGRGLSSLIPQKVNKVETEGGDTIVSITTNDDVQNILKINPQVIRVNPYQPRRQFREAQIEELMDSIQRYGLIQPLVVTVLSNDDESSYEYELIAGERRLRASQKLGLEDIPVVVRDADSQTKLELALIENIQRENLNPVETALAYRKLMDEFNIDQNELARRVGKARSSVANTIRVLNLPEHIREALIDSKISEGHAKILVGVNDVEKQDNIFKQILDNKLSVGATMKETRRMGGTGQARVQISPEDREREFALRDYLQTKVDISPSNSGGGKIVIHYDNPDILNELIEKIGDNF